MKKYFVEFSEDGNIFDTYEELTSIEAESADEAVEMAKDWLKDHDLSETVEDHNRWCDTVDNEMRFRVKAIN